MDAVNGVATVPVAGVTVNGDVVGVVVVTGGIDVLGVVDPGSEGVVGAGVADPLGESVLLPNVSPPRSTSTTTTRPPTTWTVRSSSGRRVRLNAAGRIRPWTCRPVPTRGERGCPNHRRRSIGRA